MDTDSGCSSMSTRTSKSTRMSTSTSAYSGMSTLASCSSGNAKNFDQYEEKNHGVTTDEDYQDTVEISGNTVSFKEEITENLFEKKKPSKRKDRRLGNYD